MLLKNRVKDRVRELLLLGAWIVLAFIIGAAIHIDLGWICFVAVIPLAAIGLITLSGEVAEQEAKPAVVVSTALSPDRLQMQDISRSLEQAATTLMTVSAQQGSVGDQAAVITRATRIIQDFNDLADRARREAVHLSILSRQSLTAAEAGQEALLKTVDGIRQAQQQIDQVVMLVGVLARHIRRIGEINAVVSEISTQSNFLALNAAIEAARAGDQGRSFATIADEVRALAEQARAAVTQIRDVLTQIHGSMEQTVEAMERESQTVEAGAALVTSARDTVSQVAGSLSQSSSAVQKILAAIDSQSSTIESFVTSINSVGQAALQSQAGLRLTQNIARDLSTLSDELNSIAVPARNGAANAIDHS